MTNIKGLFPQENGIISIILYKSIDTLQKVKVSTQVCFVL